MQIKSSYRVQMDRAKHASFSWFLYPSRVRRVFWMVFFFWFPVGGDVFLSFPLFRWWFLFSVNRVCYCGMLWMLFAYNPYRLRIWGRIRRLRYQNRWVCVDRGMHSIVILVCILCVRISPPFAFTLYCRLTCSKRQLWILDEQGAQIFRYQSYQVSHFSHLFLLLIFALPERRCLAIDAADWYDPTEKSVLNSMPLSVWR